MTVDIERKIIDALNTHLSTITDGWPIAWENVKFKAPSNGRYLRVQHIPAPVVSAHIDATQYQFSGVYQITVVTKVGEGADIATEQVNKVIEHFADLTQITADDAGTIIINRRPVLIGGLQGEKTYEMPIQINYHIFTD